MLTLKQILDNIKTEGGIYELETDWIEIEKIITSSINRLIDEMIGEERKPEFYIGKKEVNTETTEGYNQKVQELKEYKKKFTN